MLRVNNQGGLAFPSLITLSIIYKKINGNMDQKGYFSLLFTDYELLRLIEVGASCFNHYCVGYDNT